MHVQRVSSLALILALSGTASAAPAHPTLALTVDLTPDPTLRRLVSIGPSKANPEKGSLFDLFSKELATKRDVFVVPRRMSDRVLSKLTQSYSPSESDPALAEFAARAGALYGVHALVSLDPAKEADRVFHVLNVQVRVVRGDGQRIASTEKNTQIQTVSSEALLSEFRALAKRLVSELNLGALPTIMPSPSPAAPSASPVASSKLSHLDESDQEAMSEHANAPPRPAVTESQRVAMVAPPADPGAGQRLWGQVGLGVGAGIAAVGAILWALAGSDFARASRDSTGTLAGPQDLESWKAGGVKQMAAIASVASGAAIAGVGAALWVLAPRAPGPLTMGAAPLRSGFAFSVGGTFK
jgi:hypothetical protein